MHWVGRRRVHQVQRQQEDQYSERQKPCVLQANILGPTEQRTTLAAFGMRLGLFGRGTRLRKLLMWNVSITSTIEQDISIDSPYLVKRSGF